MAITRHGLTLEDFLRLPEEKPALEYEADGTVTQKVAPQDTTAAFRPSSAPGSTTTPSPTSWRWPFRS